MTYRLKLFACVFASVAGGMGGIFLVLWAAISFITLEPKNVDWLVARFIVAVAFVVALGVALFEGGEQ